MSKFTMNGKTVTCPLCGSDEWQSDITRQRDGSVKSTCYDCRTPVTTKRDY